MSLQVLVTKEHLRAQYERKLNYQTDCGFDCYCGTVMVPGDARAFPLYLGIKCQPTVNRGYMLVPRSSITKTPLRLANSVGIIDPSYRGEIQARVDNLSSEPFVIEGTSLFQLIWGDLTPMSVQFVDELTETQRGDGGFGSTNSAFTTYSG
jgi:dUTP pyrophosphatase